MSAQRAVATDASEESEANSEATEQSSTEQTPGAFAAALAAAAIADGHAFAEDPKPVAEDTTDEAEPEAEPEETETEETEPAETEDKPAAESEPAKLSIDDQIAAHKAKGEKPPWYLVRISEESQKRRERTDDLRKAEDRLRETETEVQQLRAQLSQSTAPVPTPQNPFVDVYDESQLQKLEQTYENMLQFAEKNRDGAENVLVGKNSDGSEKRKDFTPEEVADIRYKADKALRKDIPQRRAFLVERAKADNAALEIYPEFKDSTSDMTKEALGILRARPDLETLLGPEVLIWIGHALKGREAFLLRNGKNGKTPATNTAADKITRASQTKIAPTPTKSRALPERNKAADLTALNKQLEESGDAETAEKLVGALLSNRRSGTVRKLESVAD